MRVLLRYSELCFLPFLGSIYKPHPVYNKHTKQIKSRTNKHRSFPCYVRRYSPISSRLTTHAHELLSCSLRVMCSLHSFILYFPFFPLPLSPLSCFLCQFSESLNHPPVLSFYSLYYPSQSSIFSLLSFQPSTFQLLLHTHRYSQALALIHFAGPQWPRQLHSSI